MLTQQRTTSQSVPLSEGIVRELANMHNDQDKRISSFSPTKPLRAVYNAGTLLRRHPDRPIWDTPVYIPETEKGDFVREVLGGMINGSINPSPDQDGIPSFAARSRQGQDTCYLAENFFLDAFDRARKPRMGLPPPDLVLDNGRAVLLKKWVGSRTCLTLCDVTIDGVPYPAGSITNLKLRESAQEASRLQNQSTDRPFTRFDVSDVDSLGFLRLSLFAIPLKQQPEWEFGYGVSRHRKGLLARTSLPKVAARLESIARRS